jgi:hypothetical protein
VKVAIEIIVVSAVLILVAYGLLSAGKLTGKSVSYQVMNVVGAGVHRQQRLQARFRPPP